MGKKRNHRRQTGTHNMSSKVTVLKEYRRSVITWNTQMHRIINEVERLQRSGTLDSIDMSIALQIADICRQCRYSIDPRDRTDMISTDYILFVDYIHQLEMFLLVPTFNHLRERLVIAVYTDLYPDREERRRMIEEALSVPLAKRFSA